MHSRRAVLVAASTGILGGCHSVGCTVGHGLEATPARAIEVDVRSPNEPRRAVLETAIAEGSAEVTSIDSASRFEDVRPFEDRELVEHDGVYYEVSETVAGERDIPGLGMSAFYRYDEEPPDNATVTTFDELPSADREALRHLVFGPGYVWETPQYDGRGYPSRLPVTDIAVPYRNGTTASRLADAGETWIEWSGGTHEVQVHGDQQLTEVTYRYELTRLGSTTDAVRDHLIPDNPIRTAELPQASRDIVVAAIEDEYEVCGKPSSEYDQLLTHLDERQADPTYGRQDWYVEYEGEVYGLSRTGWVA